MEIKINNEVKFTKERNSESAMLLKKEGEAFLCRMPFNVERILELEKKHIVLQPSM